MGSAKSVAALRPLYFAQQFDGRLAAHLSVAHAECLTDACLLGPLGNRIAVHGLSRVATGQVQPEACMSAVTGLRRYFQSVGIVCLGL